MPAPDKKEVPAEEIRPPVKESAPEPAVVEKVAQEEPVVQEEVVEATQTVVKEEVIVEDEPVEETGKLSEEPVPTVVVQEVSPSAKEPTPEPVEQVVEAPSVLEETKQSTEGAHVTPTDMLVLRADDTCLRMQIRQRITTLLKLPILLKPQKLLSLPFQRLLKRDKHLRFKV